MLKKVNFPDINKNLQKIKHPKKFALTNVSKQSQQIKQILQNSLLAQGRVHIQATSMIERQP